MIDGLRYDPQDYPRYGEAPYVGLGQLLGKIEEAMERNCGNGVESCEVNLLERTVAFTVGRTAYQANGFHCGYEIYTASLPVRRLGLGWVVFPQEMDVEWKAAEPERTYTRDEAIEFLDEMFDGKWPHEGFVWRERLEENPIDGDIIALAHEYGLSDGDYCQPDDEFAYQHLYHGFLEPMVEEIKAEHEKLHADAALRRDGIRTDMTKRQLAAIRSAGIDTVGLETFYSTAKSKAAAETMADSCGTDGHLAMAIGDRPGEDPAADMVAYLGFNPWTDERYEQLRTTQASDNQK